MDHIKTLSGCCCLHCEGFHGIGCEVQPILKYEVDEDVWYIAVEFFKYKYT